MRHFGELLKSRWEMGRHVCVGLDVDVTRLPASVAGDDDADRCVNFLRAIVDSTHPYVAAYKPNLAFFEALGGPGLDCLRAVIAHINSCAPEVPVIADAKRADISSTNNGSVAALFEYLSADAVTLHPYLGHEALSPFLLRDEKGCFILCRTSNPGAGELQDLDVGGEQLFLRLARLVAEDWNHAGNCGLVAGATYPEEIAQIRERVPTLPLLIPGVGAQGGSVELTVRAAATAGEFVGVINSSRGILYASNGKDFADGALEATRVLHEEIAEIVGKLSSGSS